MIDRALPEMPCRELVELITDYLEDRLLPVERVRFEAHLAECEACRTYLDQFLQTIRVLGRLPEESLFAGLQAQLQPVAGIVQCGEPIDLQSLHLFPVNNL